MEATKKTEPTPQNDVDINKSKEDVKTDEEEEDNDSEEEETGKAEEESEEDEKKKEEVEINKRQTSMTDVVIDNNPPTDFYERTGRDHLGRKIRR